MRRVLKYFRLGRVVRVVLLMLVVVAVFFAGRSSVPTKVYHPIIGRETLRLKRRHYHHSLSVSKPRVRRRPRRKVSHLTLQQRIELEYRPKK